MVVTDEMVEKGLKLVGKSERGEGANTLEAVSLEQARELELRGEAIEELGGLIVDLETQYESNLETLNMELENNLQTAPDAAARDLLLAEHAKERERLRLKFETDRARQLEKMKQKLAGRNRTAENDENVNKQGQNELGWTDDQTLAFGEFFCFWFLL